MPCCKALYLRHSYVKGCSNSMANRRNSKLYSPGWRTQEETAEKMSNQSPKPWSDSIIYIYWRRHATRWRTSHVCAFVLFGGGTIAQARRRLNGVVSILCWIDCDLHNQICRLWSWLRTCMNMQQQWEENLLMQTSKAANQTTTEQ